MSRTTATVLRLALLGLTSAFAACNQVPTTATGSTSTSGVAAATTPSNTPTTSVTGNTTAPTSNVAFFAGSYSINQPASTVVVSVHRSGTTGTAASVKYATAPGTALAGTDYASADGTLQWTENDSTDKSIAINVMPAAFSGKKTFSVTLSDPSSGTNIASPGSATVTISGSASASAGTLELADAAYTVAENGGSVTISVNRSAGAVGATSVSYATRNGTANAGTDYTATKGTLQWLDGEGTAKSFVVPIIKGAPYSGERTFAVTLTDASAGAMLGDPSNATVAITGDASPPVGTVQLGATQYNVAQNVGSVPVRVTRTGGSRGAVSVSYATRGGSAVAGTNFTATSGTLTWEDGDESPKGFSVVISNAKAFSGDKSFAVFLSTPTGGAGIGSPGSATVSIAGDAVSPAAGVAWGYYDGTFNWGGDYSWNVSLNYEDTSGEPLSGAHDLKVSLTGQWGGWQPFMCSGVATPLPACLALYDYPLGDFTYLTFALKPTIANQQWSAQFIAVGDKGIPCNYANPYPISGAGVDVLAYGPAPVVGQWATYKVPLSAFCVGPGTSNVNIYKFHIQDQTGLASNTWYVDNVGFE
jgi:hypothetical protein